MFVEYPQLKSKIDETIETGIKLLGDSKYFLKELDEDLLNYNEHNRKQKRKKKFDDRLNEERCKMVTVSGGEILAKVDTKYWSNRSKAKVYLYKKDKNMALCKLVENKTQYN